MTNQGDDNPLEDMRKLVRKAQLSAEQDIEFINTRAVLYRAAYDSLLSQKFTDEQAMRFIIARGPLLL